MLSLDDKVMMERSVLGTFCEYPKICSNSIKYVNGSMFSSEYRKSIYERLNAQISEGFAITKEKTWGGLMSTDDQRNEMTKIISSSRPDNLKPYIKALIEDESLSKLYKVFQNAQDMVVSDKLLKDVVKYVANQMALTVPDETDEYSASLLTAVDEIKNNISTYQEYPIGWSDWDNITPFTPQSIMLLAGNEGSFKTKFMIFMMRKLLKGYSDVAVKWFSMEDPRDKLIRGFVSQDLLMSDKELREIDYIDHLSKDILKYDIEFVNKASTITEIGNSFKTFKDQRPDKFCILLVDNIMKIVPSKEV